MTARDRGCRFPGSHDPAGLTHRHRWSLTLNPASGGVTAARHHRRWRSLPHGTPLTNPTDDP